MMTDFAAASAFALAAASPFVRERASAMHDMQMAAAPVSPVAWLIAALALGIAVGLVAVARARGFATRLSPLRVGIVGAALVTGALAGFDLCGLGFTDANAFGFTGCHCWLTGVIGAFAGVLALVAVREARAMVRAFAAYVADLLAALAGIAFAPARVPVRIRHAAPLRRTAPHVRRTSGRAPPHSIA